VVAGDALGTTAGGAGGAAGLFDFEPATGCADYPEIETNVTGSMPATNAPGAPVQGFVETHMHQMAFEFLGSQAHCGRPWHRFGAPFALKDCDDHTLTNGCGAILETALSGTTCHNPGGWPDFSGWPTHQQLTHEQSYYKWLERSYRGGLKIFVNLLVENRVLCEIYPLKPVGHSCNEMETVRREAQRMRELERYIDAQSGGPGEGWYRIVDDPAEARQVINDGKLAVVMGMEVSEPFGCRLMQPGDVPTCTDNQVEDGLDELWDLGVRQLELINKFDNGLAGVAGDSGSTGTITSGGNLLSAGRFWDLEHCDEPVNHDHSPTGLQHNDDELIANGLLALLPGGTLPVYGPPPHCNQMGLTELGEQAIEGIIDRGMMFDPDHMSVMARNRALEIMEQRNYGGVMTSHSWSTDNALPRISALGGLIGPMARDSQGFVDQWNHLRTHGYDDLNPGLFGIGRGADMNGFASQGGPRTPTTEAPAVSYPFQSFDGTATIHKQVSGQRTFDINTDGVAHYGLFPDWAEDVRILGGPEVMEDLANGAEAYLQMWERSTGIRPMGSTPGPGGAGDDGAAAAKQKQCSALRKKMKRAKSKRAKRKLRRKLKKKGC
jgi:microsomal dipeptidase-like Zn-dependent dipeptidase